jgi:hypothetical protein
LLQAVVVPPKVPFDWHVAMALPEHVVCPGAQVPVHAPDTHVWLVHAVPATHPPVALHVSGWLEPEQLVWPGAHTPWHAPLTQLWFVQALPATHAPLPLHVCGWFEAEQLV